MPIISLKLRSNIIRPIINCTILCWHKSMCPIITTIQVFPKTMTYYIHIPSIMHFGAVTPFDINLLIG